MTTRLPLGCAVSGCPVAFVPGAQAGVLNVPGAELAFCSRHTYIGERLGDLIDRVDEAIGGRIDDFLHEVHTPALRVLPGGKR